MFNVGGGELLVILLVALIVLGPTKLPEVARQVGSVARELRRMSTKFQDEMKAAMDDPVETAARDRGNKVVSREIAAAPVADESDHPTENPPVADTGDEGDSDPEEPDISTAEAAGMYDVGSSTDVEEDGVVADEASTPAADNNPTTSA